MRRGSAAHSAAIFAQGDVANPMQAVLDVPMVLPPPQQLIGSGEPRTDAGDGVFLLDNSLAAPSRGPYQTTDLGHARPIQGGIQSRAGLKMATYQAAVSLLDSNGFTQLRTALVLAVGGKSPPEIRRPRLLSASAGCL